MKYWISILLLALLSAAGACTIGVADGRATAGGRPLLWKTRDSSGINNGLRRVTDEGYTYVTVADPADPSAWMGVNEHGLGVLNSLSNDLDEGTRFGNGELMRRALAGCRTAEDFQQLLIDTSGEGRITLGNFGVIDSTGAASIFEVGQTTFTRFNTADTEEGYLIRSNFSITGGGTAGTARYERAHTIIRGLVQGNSLRHDTLARTMLRDLSDVNAQPFELPYQRQWSPGSPFGYIDADWSICSNTTVSAAVIEGVLPGEPAWLSTLWAMPGNPFACTMLPCWPRSPVPQLAALQDDTTPSPITMRAKGIMSGMFNLPLQATWLDTWKLYDEDGGGWLPNLMKFEELSISLADSLMAFWRQNPPTYEQMGDWADTFAEASLAFLSSVDAPTSVVADFSATPTVGGAPLTVQFTDRSRHYPQQWAWDFDGDGATDSQVMNPSFTFTQPGSYDVTLRIDNGASSITQAACVTVYSAWLGQSYPNPFSRQAVIEYSTPRAGHVRLKVYNIRGQLVDTLEDSWKDAGEHTAVWFPQLARPQTTASGVYIYRLQGPGINRTRRMVYIK